MAFGQQQQAVAFGGRGRSAAGVVQQGLRDEQLGAVGLQRYFERIEIGPIRVARHGHQVQVQRANLCREEQVAGVLDQHRVARPQQCAQQQLKRVRCAERGDDLAWRCRNATGLQPISELTAQARRALRWRRRQQRVAALRHARHQRGGYHIGQPALGQKARALGTASCAASSDCRGKADGIGWVAGDVAQRFKTWARRRADEDAVSARRGKLCGSRRQNSEAFIRCGCDRPPHMNRVSACRARCGP